MCGFFSTTRYPRFDFQNLSPILTKFGVTLMLLESAEKPYY